MAAPNTTPTTAQVVDLDATRRRIRARPREQHEDPDAIRTAWKEARAEVDDQFIPRLDAAIETALRRDLAGWPEAFRRRLLDDVTTGRRPGWPWGIPGDEWRLWDALKERRALGTERVEPDPSACICGCQGFNAEVADRLRKLREAAHELRKVSKPFMVERRRADLEDAKRELLGRMWLAGVRRIDRAQLAEHVEHEANDAREHLEQTIRHERKTARHCKARLADGRSQRKGHEGQPLSELSCSQFRGKISKAKEREREARRTLAALKPLLGNRRALVAEWTGNTDTPRLAFGFRGEVRGVAQA